MARVTRNGTNQTWLTPTSLTHSAGTITAVVGTKTYTVSVGSPTANTLYHLYLRISGGTLTMFAVTTIPSTYRVSFPEAVLVGAYYSNGITTPAFGTFVNIDGVPTSQPIQYNPVVSGLTLTSSEMMWWRYGLQMFVDGKYVVATVAGTEGQLGLPSSYASAAAAIIPSLRRSGTGSQTDIQMSIEPGVGYFTYISFGATPAKQNGSTVLTVSDTAHINASTPITGWSNTPLKDL